MPSQSDLIRISVANLAMVVRGGTNHHYFGVANPKILKERGVFEYQALGGAVQLTGAGVGHLIAAFGADNFEKDRKTGLYDARFLAPADQLEKIFDFFSHTGGTENPYEHDSRDDIMEELFGGEYGNLGPILPEDQRRAVDAFFSRVTAQPPPQDGAGTSERAQAAGVLTRRLFRWHSLYMPTTLMIRFLQSPVVRELSVAELATTIGGRQKGYTNDGKVLRDNLFLAP